MNVAFADFLSALVLLGKYFYMHQLKKCYSYYPIIFLTTPFFFLSSLTLFFILIFIKFADPIFSFFFYVIKTVCRTPQSTFFFYEDSPANSIFIYSFFFPNTVRLTAIFYFPFIFYFYSSGSHPIFLSTRFFSFFFKFVF